MLGNYRREIPSDVGWGKSLKLTNVSMKKSFLNIYYVQKALIFNRDHRY